MSSLPALPGKPVLGNWVLVFGIQTLELGAEIVNDVELVAGAAGGACIQ